MDRLDYTKRMIESLERTVGGTYVHVFVDQGSCDGTVEYLHSLQTDGSRLAIHIICLEKNVGISAGSNIALMAASNYDARYIVKIDNDCSLDTECWDTRIAAVSERMGNRVILSPFVRGLRENKGGAPRYHNASVLTEICTESVGFTNHLGGICEFSPTEAYNGFSFDDGDTLSGSQDSSFSAHVLREGFRMAYLEDVFCTHMDTTDGQHAKYPAYFDRRKKYDSKTRFSDL